MSRRPSGNVVFAEVVSGHAEEAGRAIDDAGAGTTAGQHVDDVRAADAELARDFGLGDSLFNEEDQEGFFIGSWFH